MFLAYELGRSEDEILDMTASDFARWFAFLKILRDKRKK